MIFEKMWTYLIIVPGPSINIILSYYVLIKIIHSNHIETNTVSLNIIVRQYSYYLKTNSAFPVIILTWLATYSKNICIFF